MSKFRKKPVVVDAIQWTGDNLDELFKLGDFKLHYTYVNNDILGVYTIDGSVCWPSVGDWVIMGPYGEFYTCKKDIFKETYEEVFGHIDITCNNKVINTTVDNSIHTNPEE